MKFNNRLMSLSALGVVASVLLSSQSSFADSCPANYVWMESTKSCVPFNTVQFNPTLASSTTFSMAQIYNGNYLAFPLSFNSPGVPIVSAVATINIPAAKAYVSGGTAVSNNSIKPTVMISSSQHSLLQNKLMYGPAQVSFTINLTSNGQTKTLNFSGTITK
jgi:subtilase family serine protease